MASCLCPRLSRLLFCDCVRVCARLADESDACEYLKLPSCASGMWPSGSKVGDLVSRGDVAMSRRAARAGRAYPFFSFFLSFPFGRAGPRAATGSAKFGVGGDSGGAAQAIKTLWRVLSIMVLFNVS